METPSTPPSRRELAEKLSADLVGLRDALLTMSLALKDWQLELDQRSARNAEKIANAALEKYTLGSAPGCNANPAPQSHPKPAPGNGPGPGPSAQPSASSG